MREKLSYSPPTLRVVDLELEESSLVASGDIPPIPWNEDDDA